MVLLKFPDGSEKEYDSITGEEIAKSISERFLQEAVAIKINEKIIDLKSPIKEDGNIRIITIKDDDSLPILRHTAAHVLAQAMLRKRPDAKPTIGPVIEDGFFYDFLTEPVTPDFLRELEEEMKKIVKEDYPIIRKEITKEEAKILFKDNKYKLELIEEMDDVISIYKQGEFLDLCRGPHLPRTGLLKAFKLTKSSSSYWRGDSKNDILQRIYGIAFNDKKKLKDYLFKLEEAKKRDHRKIGKELDLFSFQEEAPGMPFFHDRGTFIWDKLVDFVKELMIKRNYELNKTPMILNKKLWLQSGHWDHYKENMYFTKIDDVDYAVKPMNCPGNILIYKSHFYSYRDLPLRAGEFGLVHRHELSGVLSGLFRVRCFTQDDAHIFCTKEQLESEIKDLIDFMDEVYSKFGFNYEIELSTKPEKAMGDPKLWELAEETLKNVLENNNKQFTINEGDGAFYGPKIDFHIKDAIGRTWQCGTIQLDFQMPEKFDLTYEGSDGQKHRPVMIHRAILGSVERFMGILLEHYAGKLPFWINPNQVMIIPIADRHNDYARKIHYDLKINNIRADINLKAETTNKKIRDAELNKYYYIVVIGDKEIENNSVSVRRDNKVEVMDYNKFKELLINKNNIRDN